MTPLLTLTLVVAYVAAITWLLHRPDPRAQAWRREARAGLVLAFSYGLVGLEYVLDTTMVSRSAIGEAVGAYTAVFYLLYILGALLMLGAFVKGRRDLEGAALVACGTGWALNGTVLAAAQPQDLRYGVFVVWVLYAVNRLRELVIAAR